MASRGARARPPGGGGFLPPDPRVEEPYRFTPQLALRIGILAAVALVVFGILFFRLWALQVLSGPRYLKAAQDNQVRSVRIEAQRGEIFDRNGHPLVATVPGTAVQLSPADLPKTWPARLAELKRLSMVLNVPVHQMLVGMKRIGNDPITPVTVRESVNRDAPINYLAEHSEQFPGVRIVNTYLRSYTYGSLAAQLLGYVSEISPEQLKQLKGKGYEGGDKIGQAGLESAYDSYLRGRPGLAQVTVDSLGQARSAVVPTRRPTPGESIRLTLDINLQRAAERALRFGIQTAINNGQWEANAGAIVALDPRDGSIRAMASYPTFDPRVYTGRVTNKRLASSGPDRGDRRAGQLPVAEPSDQRALPRRLDVQADHRARRAADARHLARDVAPLYRDVRRPQARRVDRARRRLQERRPLHRRDDEPADRARRLVRHVVLPAGLRLLQRAAERRPSAAGVGLEVRDRPEDGRRRGPRVSRIAADSRVARPDVHGEDRPAQLGGRPPLEARRLDPARDRPEGPARDAAPDGALLRDPRQRRQARAPPPRRGRRGGRRRPLAAGRSPLHAARAAVGRHRPHGAGGRPGRPLPGDARVLRHIGRRLQQLPDPDRGQDRDGAEGSEHQAEGPVVVVRLRAGRELGATAARRLRADRERRLRRRRSRPRRAEGVRAVLPHRRQRNRGARADDRGRQHPREGPRAGQGRADPPGVVRPPARLDPARRGRGAARLRALGDRRDHEERHHGRVGLLRRPPDRVRRRRRGRARARSADRPRLLPALQEGRSTAGRSA